MIARSLLSAIVLSLFAVVPAVAGELAVSNAWSRTTPPGVGVGVVYLKIQNNSTKSDRLLKLKASVASSAEVHRTDILEGAASMHEVSTLHIAVGERRLVLGWRFCVWMKSGNL